MVLPDEPSGLQGVTDTGGDSGDVAPAFPGSEPESDPSLGGEPAQADDGDRADVPDKNRYKELQRKYAKLEDRLESMQIELAAQALASERSQTSSEPEKPPYSDTEMDAILNDGDMKRWSQMKEANLEWKVQRQIQAASTQQSQATRAQAVDRHIEKIIQVDEDSDFGQAVARRARELRTDHPGFAPQFYTLMAKAEMAGNNSPTIDDLRGESLSRSAARSADVPEASGVPKEMKINYDAPNRGLPNKVVAELRKHGLEELLVKGPNPQVEARRRASLDRFLVRHGEIQRWRSRR